MAHEHQVNITIDDKPEVSPKETTGAALYVLGKVQQGYDLFRETRKKGDDELIPNDTTAIKVHEDDEFYTAQSDLNPGR